MIKADQKARLAKSHASAVGQIPMLAGEPSDVPGFQAWVVGKVMVLMRKLLPATPASIRRRYRDRIIANATGQCPRCRNIAGDPGPGKMLDNGRVMTPTASLRPVFDCRPLGIGHPSEDVA